MKTPIRNFGKIFDPIKLAQFTKYIGNLNVISNNTSIVPRDVSGNIQLNEESETNPLLIIEPTATKIQLASVLKVLDTRFQYFKFPVTTQVTPEPLPSFDLSLPEQAELTDPVYARYKPSENSRILTIPDVGGALSFSGILMDEVVDGQIQTNVNTYYITKEVKQSGADLRFRIKINHRYDAPTPESGGSRVFFSIIKQGPDYPLNRRFKGPFTPVGRRGTGGIIEPYEVISTIIDIVIANDEFNIGDNFNIGANADRNSEFIYHTINAEQTYWAITDASKNVDLWNQEIS
jgi:hypothetical protein